MFCTKKLEIGGVVMSGMSKETMLFALEQLNEKLKENNQKGEITMYGGAVMSLVLDVRDSTNDIDAMFYPTDCIYQYAREIRQKSTLSLPVNWINDSVHIYVESSHSSDIREYISFSNLVINAASPEYMLAMKAYASRIDESSKDVSDLEFLVNYLDVKNLNGAMNVVLKYFHEKFIKRKTVEVLGTILNSENYEIDFWIQYLGEKI